MHARSPAHALDAPPQCAPSLLLRAQVLIADFFVVLAILAWLAAGAALKVGGSDALITPWLALWTPLFQPAIGLLMAGALVSGGINWLEEKQKPKQ